MSFMMRRLFDRSGPLQKQLQESVDYIKNSGLFDQNGYLRRYPDVAKAGMDAVEHYVRHGAAEGRNPCDFFDTEYYLRSNPDVRNAAINPFHHFCEFGWKEGRNPSAGFDLAKYASEQMGSSSGTMNPLLHRLQNPVAKTEPKRGDFEIISASGLFDSAYYLREYPDVSVSGMDPLRHFIRFGAKEERNPSAYFDTAYYRKSNPDVVASGMNSLRHYCLYGWKELRNPSPALDACWYWMTSMQCELDVSPLLHLQTIGPADGAGLRPSVPLSRAERQSLTEAAKAAIEHGRLGSDVYTQMGRCLEKWAVWDCAESAYRHAMVGAPENARAYLDLARTLEKQNKHWQKVELLADATTILPHEAELWFQLGQALEQMNRHEKAAEAFSLASELVPDDANVHFRLGLSLERASRLDAALAAYERACGLDTTLNAQRLGVGAFHEKAGNWKEACEAYRRQSKSNPTDPLLHFKHGLALDRCYEWELALASFRTAIGLANDMGTPYWHYRMGYVLERLGKFDEAANAYAWAVSRNNAKNSYWNYRLGYVLAAAGRHSEACRAYLSMWPAADSGAGSDVVDGVGEADYFASFVSSSAEFLREEIASDFQDAEKHFKLGTRLQLLGDFSGAAKSYSRAIDRSDAHVPKWHHALGVALYHQGKPEEACDAFAGVQALRRPFGIQAPDPEKNPALRASMEYCECLEALPLRNKTVLYDSYNGASVSGNPYAIFVRLLMDPSYADWTHVWAVKDRSLMPRRYRKHKNVIFVTRESFLYRRYLATATHLISNTTLPPWFIRRDGQRYLNTWHGTPLKTLGRDMRGRFLEHKTFTRNLLHATHIISPNRHTTRVLLDKHEVKGLLPGMLAETGYPRVDLTVAPDPRRKAEIRRQLGIAAGEQVVLYAPTWRGTHGAIHFDFKQLESDLKRLGELDARILFRGHALLEGLVSRLSVDVVPNDIDTNELLGLVDVLVTDYSSVFFDYLPRRKPIFFYAYDLDEYERQRGLYFDMKGMAGTLCRTIDELVRGVSDALQSPDDFTRGVEAAIDEFCPMEDGKATDRVISFLMHDDATHVVREQEPTGRSVLMYAGDFVNNGITSSFLNLLRAMEKADYSVTLALDHGNVSAQPMRMERFSEVPDSVQRIPRIGGMVLDPEEKWIVDSFNRRYSLPSARMREIYRKAYDREFKRVFGQIEFDAHVQFEGFLRYWASLFAAGTDRARKSIFLHSDIVAEYLVRFPHLRAIFSIYPEYDQLVSVSEVMRDVNAEKLTELRHIPGEKFVYCPNAIDAEAIRAKADEAMDSDLQSWVEGRYVFLTIGRLSPEKDHAKLIRAFDSVQRLRPETVLIIVGDGPMAHDLRALIAQLGLEARVLLAGARVNPFPLLRGASCFVLSSNHEGQPMVLLEAMVLSKPLVATDISGNRAVLEQFGGLLVPNSEEGLRDGMLTALNGNARISGFNAKAYQDDVMSSFSAIVGGADVESPKTEFNGEEYLRAQA